MTEDIVKRLSDYIRAGFDKNDVLKDARNEIERLREYSSKQALDIVTLGQEVGRLRIALQIISRANTLPFALEIACAALAEQEEK